MKVYDITPMGKPRMTRADKWKKRPEVLRYRAFCDEVRLQGVDLPESGSHVTFILPMPASWSKKKRAELNGKPHQAKPDFDNMMKALIPFTKMMLTSGIHASLNYGERRGK